MPENASQNQNNQDLINRKAKLMAVRLTAYEEQNRPSYLEKLENGALRRAVEREASFNVNAYRNSNQYAEKMSEEDINTLYYAHCEYYAKLILDNRNRSNYNPFDTNDFEHNLMKRDATANQNFEDTSYTIKEGDLISKTSITQNKVQARAKTIDDNVTAQNKNVAEHIQKMKMMQEIRVYH